MAPPTLLDIFSGVVTVISLYYIHQKRKNRSPLPPGPKGYPIVGNFFDISSNMWVKFRDWSKEIGSDIISINVLGNNIVVLHSLEAVNDLLDKRSTIYSDRPYLPMKLELMGFWFNVPSVPYGSQWRNQRRLMHHVLHPMAVKNFRPHTLKAAHSVLRRFLDMPGDVTGHVRHMAGETIITIAYGLEVKPHNDTYINDSEEAVHTLANTPLFSSPVDLLPCLKYVPEWVPAATFHTKAKAARKVAHKVLEGPYKAAKDRIESGNYIPSFVSYCASLLSQQPAEDSVLQEEVMKGTASSLYIAGSDTTSSTIIFCIYFLVNHPDVLKQAQVEIDSVISFGELPTFEEEGRLPYINALCMETMRLKELLPLSVPHRLTQEDVYRGYKFPKGTIFLVNAWAMMHDETVYPEPFSFKPERFLKDGRIDKEVLDPTKVIFGFGRRICPGRYLAYPAVWLTVASIVAAFDITKSLDANGNSVEVDVSDNDCAGILRFPKRFPCSMNPRSAQHEQAIRATLNGDE